MKVGLQINRFNFESGSEKIAPTLLDMAQAADESGFDSEWVMDHLWQISSIGPATDPMLEAYTTLGFMAGVTKKVSLGTMVGGVTYREPALLVKAVTTLDVLSGGRAYWGIGAGWNDEESQGLGLLSPIGNNRFERLEEALKIGLQMWSGEQTPFNGEFYKLGKTLSSPQPLSKPHPPILIGGGGEQKTLRLVAKYADACNLFPSPQLEHKLDVLRHHCEDLGRNYDDIEKTALFGMGVRAAADDPDEALSRAKTMRKLGIDHVILSSSSEADTPAFQKFSREVLPELHSL